MSKCAIIYEGRLDVDLDRAFDDVMRKNGYKLRDGSYEKSVRKLHYDKQKKVRK